MRKFYVYDGRSKREAISIKEDTERRPMGDGWHYKFKGLRVEFAEAGTSEFFVGYSKKDLHHHPRIFGKDRILFVESAKQRANVAYTEAQIEIGNQARQDIRDMSDFDIGTPRI